MFRPLCGTVVYLLFLPTLVAAQQQVITVVARDSFPLRIGERVTGQAQAGEVFSLITAQDDMVWVQNDEGKRGWLNRDQVVPVEKAQPIYDRLIQREPDQAVHYERRAWMWWNRGQMERAAEDYDAAVKLGSQNPEVFVYRGIHRATQGDLEQAVADYDQAIELGQEDAYVFVNRGVARFALGRHEDAITDFDVAIERGTASFSVYVNRAAARLAAGQEAGAIEDLDAAIALEPENPAGYYERGRAWQQLEKLDQAIEDFTEALRLDPEFVHAYGSRGFAWFLKEEPEKAIADFDQLIQRNPQSAVAFNNRGYNRQLLGRYADAAADFDQAIELAPQYSLAYENKAWLLATCPDQEVRDGAAAVAAAQKAGELTGWESPGARKALAAAYAETGEFDKAVAEQTKVLEQAPQDEKEKEQQLLDLYQSERPYRMGQDEP